MRLTSILVCIIGAQLFSNSAIYAQSVESKSNDVQNIKSEKNLDKLTTTLCRSYPKLGLEFLRANVGEKPLSKIEAADHITKQAKNYNIAFIRLHELRLIDDINQIEKTDLPDSNNWYTKSQRESLLNKKKQLEVIQNAYSKIQNDLSQDRPFHSLADVENYVKNGKIPLLTTDSAKGGRFVSKAGPSQEQNGLNRSRATCNLTTAEPPKEFRALLNYRDLDDEFYNRLCPQERKASAILSDQTSDFFDHSKYPKHQEFLKALGIIAPTSTEVASRKAFDLSAEYPAPQRQILFGNVPSKACVAYALVSDMEYTGKTPELSPDFAYGMMRATRELLYQEDEEDPIQSEEKKKPGTLKNRLSLIPDDVEGAMKKKLLDPSDHDGNIFDVKGVWDAGITVTDATDILKTIKIPPLTSSPKGQFFPKSLKAVPNQIYSIKSEANLYVKTDHGDPAINYGLMKLLIDTKNPPAVLITNEARVEQDGWIEPVSTGGIRHMVNVVGYGEGINPFDLRKRPYFVVRDSLGDKEIHYKIDAETFLQETEDLVKVTEVQK